MRIHVVADDLLFPNNSGGRMEALGLTRALQQAGHEITATIFQREDVSDADLAANRAVAPGALVLTRPSFVSSTLRDPTRPFQLSSRLFAATDIDLDPAPEVVLAHHEWAVPFARRIARRYGVPLILRSHNDEVGYLRALMRAARNPIKRSYYAAEYLRATRWFRAPFYAGVDAVLVISPEDAPFYSQRGIAADYLPATLSSISASSDEGAPLEIGERENTVVFAGSLDMTHAVEGLSWFAQKVWPTIHRATPDARFVVVGRRATDELAATLRATDGVDFRGEVPSVEPLLASARAFVNPVFSGSGVNMKMGPPAQAGTPIVTTTQGLRGLGTLADAVSVADTPDAFARAVTALLTDDVLWTRSSAEVRTEVLEFGPVRIAERFNAIAQRIIAERA